MIGTVVGNYKITEKIGEGGMGAVFKGIDEMLEREVAIKMLKPDFTRDTETAERFRAEAITLAKLNHPNIATLHNFFRHGDDYFMVMEFVRGETIDHLIRRTGAIPADRAVALFGQALAGIGHAHTMGIVHRDIKPANMMLTEKGSVKVMDFGIARVLGTNRMTRQGTIVGTVEYMAPEQIKGEDSDSRTDIYSLGILLYEMVTGRVPFISDSEFKLMMAQIHDAPPPPRQFVPNLPLHVEQSIMRALAKKPEARFETVGEFRTALEAARMNLAPITEKKSVPAPTGVIHAAAYQDTVETKRLDTAPSTSQSTSVNPAVSGYPQNAVNHSGTQIIPPAYQQRPQSTPSGTQVMPQQAGSAYGSDPSLSFPPPHTPLAGKSSWKIFATIVPLLVVLGGGGYYVLNSKDKPGPAQYDVAPPATNTTTPPVKLDTKPTLPQPAETPPPQPPSNEKATEARDALPAEDEEEKAAESSTQQKRKRDAARAAARDLERRRREAKKLLEK